MSNHETLAELLDRLSQQDDDRLFKIEVANAYRTGALVPREAVEGAVEALKELVEEYVENVDVTRLAGFYLDPETEECVIKARAALAAINGGQSDADG